jgi:DNA integrity scanning protein DisA with diadenylate cyclase activity
VKTAPSSRVARLADELVESGLPRSGEPWVFDLVVEEADRALRPPLHERRIPSSGSIVSPTTDSSTWAAVTGLTIIRAPVMGGSLADARLFADGLSSWLVRRPGDVKELLMFDRPAGSERDLVVLSTALGAVIVQRHPSGTVRLVGAFGVLRTEGFRWHHEPPIDALLDLVVDSDLTGRDVTKALLEFAVHDLGARGIGALLILRSGVVQGRTIEERLPAPPALRVGTPFHLAPLRHALSQIDGAAVFDRGGTLCQLGIRLVPSLDAEDRVDPLGGTRHTSARRYSYDDPSALIVVVSEDGPVTVFREGKVLGRSPGDPDVEGEDEESHA